MRVFDCHGIRIDSISTEPKCVILNSRQSKRPCNRDDWVQSTQSAVNHALSERLSVVSSVGLNTWELVTHLTNTGGGLQIVILPPHPEELVGQLIADVIADFKLDPARCQFILPESEPTPADRLKDSWPERDRLAIELAEQIFPVSIRPNGNLEQLLSQATTFGKAIREDFRAPYRRPVDRASYDLSSDNMNPLFNTLEHSYIMHWTRSSHGPYPGETRFEYYRDILSFDSYPRSGLHTLANIIREGLIRGSNRFIRGGRRVVSSSALQPSEAVGLMYWRKRYVYFGFEPYGIAIRSDIAHATGMRPVIYGDSSLYASLPESDKPFFQNQGSGSADWRPEEEWRYLGDLDLNQLPDEGMRIIVYSNAEVEMIRKLTGRQVWSLTVI